MSCNELLIVSEKWCLQFILCLNNTIYIIYIYSTAMATVTMACTQEPSTHTSALPLSPRHTEGSWNVPTGAR